MNKQSMQSSASTKLCSSTVLPVNASIFDLLRKFSTTFPILKNLAVGPFCRLGQARLSHTEICVASSVQEKGIALNSDRLLAGIYFRS